MTREERPTIEQLERELARRDRISRYIKSLKMTLLILLVVGAIAVLAATLWVPMLRVSGTSMTPELNQDDVVIVLRKSEFKCGEVVAFYYHNKILLKRVIAGEGDWVDIDEEGNVYVNDILLEEPYAVNKEEGQGDITYPYQVPEDSWFVLGDHRNTSVDSRSSEIGCIKNEDMLGSVFLRIYPFHKITFLVYLHPKVEI